MFYKTFVNIKNTLAWIWNLLDKLRYMAVIKSLCHYRSRRETRRMASVFDVARYILERKKILTTVKLQKLVYYCQAWSLVWDEQPLFDEEIQAWANGPVVPDLFQCHKGKFQVTSSDIPYGDTTNLDDLQKETINAVLEYYGEKSAQWLVDLSHLEEPWRNARGKCGTGEYCSSVISQGAMIEYYSGLA